MAYRHCNLTRVFTVYTSKEELIELCEGIKGYFLAPEFVIEQSRCEQGNWEYKELVARSLDFNTIR